MPYDENLAAKVRTALQGKPGIKEQKMFGGLCFLHNGNMLCGVDKEKNLMVRVGPDQYEKALKMKHARVMDFTGRPLKGLVYVSPEGYKTKSVLGKWIEMALRFATTLPNKKNKTI